MKFLRFVLLYILSVSLFVGLLLTLSLSKLDDSNSKIENNELFVKFEQLHLITIKTKQVDSEYIYMGKILETKDIESEKYLSITNFKKLEIIDMIIHPLGQFSYIWLAWFFGLIIDCIKEGNSKSKNKTNKEDKESL